MNEITKQALFLKLYAGISNRIYSYLLIMLHNRESAEEVAQETAMILWSRFDEYEQGTNFGAWAITIARLKAFEFLRKRRQSHMIFDDRFYEQVSDRAGESSEDLPKRIDALNACLRKLSEKQIALLSMRFKKNISIKKIAQITGQPAGSLYHRFSRIHRGLRICVEKQLIQQTRQYE